MTQLVRKWLNVLGRFFLLSVFVSNDLSTVISKERKMCPNIACLPSCRRLCFCKIKSHFFVIDWIVSFEKCWSLNACIFSLRIAALALIRTFFYVYRRSLLVRIEKTKRGSNFSKQPSTADVAISASNALQAKTRQMRARTIRILASLNILVLRSIPLIHNALLKVW